LTRLGVDLQKVGNIRIMSTACGRRSRSTATTRSAARRSPAGGGDERAPSPIVCERKDRHRAAVAQETELARRQRQVRFRMHCRRDMLTVRFSAIDPKRTTASCRDQRLRPKQEVRSPCRFATGGPQMTAAAGRSFVRDGRAGLNPNRFVNKGPKTRVGAWARSTDEPTKVTKRSI
jgi:hypothetical protein